MTAMTIPLNPPLDRETNRRNAEQDSLLCGSANYANAVAE